MAKNNIFLIVLIILIILIILITIISIYFIYINTKPLKEYFIVGETSTTQGTTTTNPLIPIDRTKLYGSIFLENLSDVITNMTNPGINYDTKRIELNKYIDILS